MLAAPAVVKLAARRRRAMICRLEVIGLGGYAGS